MQKEKIEVFLFYIFIGKVKLLLYNYTIKIILKYLVEKWNSTNKSCLF